MNSTYRPNILIIDDEASIQRLLKISLESNGFSTESAKSAQEGISLAISHSFAAILLDLGLPDLNGIEVLSKLRNKGVASPIIVLTVVDDDESKVAALDLGADDYVTKPFSIPELLARVRVAIRHSNSPELQKDVIMTGPILIDLNAHQIKVNDVEIKLTPIEFQIMSILAINLGKVVTHRILLNKIWGPNSVEHVQYLRVHLGQIRKKLKDQNADDYLLTEAGVGYRLAEK